MTDMNMNNIACPISYGSKHIFVGLQSNTCQIIFSWKPAFQMCTCTIESRASTHIISQYTCSKPKHMQFIRPGKRPCCPESQVMFKRPWVLTWDATVHCMFSWLRQCKAYSTPYLPLHLHVYTLVLYIYTQVIMLLLLILNFFFFFSRGPHTLSRKKKLSGNHHVIELDS